MGRIIDTRDPDTYISFEEYENCVKRARAKWDKVRENFKIDINKKLLVLNAEIDFDSRLINDRTYTDIYLIMNGNRVKLGCCYESNGEYIDKTTKKFLKKHFEEFLDNIIEK